MTQPSLDFTQLELDAALQASGLQPDQNFVNTCPASLAWLRHEATATRLPLLLSLLGEEVPGLVPLALHSAQVLYFALPGSMTPLVGQLLRAEWDCYGELTDSPWENGVYLALRDFQTQCGHACTGPLLSFRYEALDLSRAFADGFAILMFDCEGTLYSRGVVVGDDLGIALSACATSTFQRPLRLHSVRYLQERTRAVEDTGLDPEGRPNGGYPVLPVLCSRLAQGKPLDLSRLPEHKKRHLPRASWHRISDAVIGWLPEVTHFQEECAGESPLVLKVTVMPEMYQRIQSGEFSSVVRLGPDVQLCDDPTYVLLVESGDELTAVTMPSCDGRFRAVYRYWGRVGSCQVVFENFHNGRLHRSRVTWPATGRREGNCVDAVDEPGDGRTAGHCTSADALVHERVRETGVCLTCYICGVTDQEDWREGREEN